MRCNGPMTFRLNKLTNKMRKINKRSMYHHICRVFWGIPFNSMRTSADPTNRIQLVAV